MQFCVLSGRITNKSVSSEMLPQVFMTTNSTFIMPFHRNSTLMGHWDLPNPLNTHFSAVFIP